LTLAKNNPLRGQETITFSFFQDCAFSLVLMVLEEKGTHVTADIEDQLGCEVTRVDWDEDPVSEILRLQIIEETLRFVPFYRDEVPITERRAYAYEWDDDEDEDD